MTIGWFDRSGHYHRQPLGPAVDPNRVLAAIRRQGGTIHRVDRTPKVG